MSGTHCPVCQKSIGIWPIIKAPLPSQIYCPHCESRLKYRGNHIPMIAVSVLFFIMILFYAIDQAAVIDKIETWQSVIVIILFCLAFWAPFELFFALYLRSKYKLKACEKHHAEKIKNSNSKAKPI